MAIFGKKNKYYKGSLVQSIAEGASANAASQTNESSQTSAVVLEGRVSESAQVQFANPSIEKTLEGKNKKDEELESQPVSSKAWDIDIAQSHHYTVQLSGFQNLNTPEGSLGGAFLPVKSIQLAYTSYENMSIPLNIFGDFPLLNRKRVSTIQLTCYDKDSDIIERQIRAWGDSCFPKNKYVAYLSNIIREFKYNSFDVKGKLNFSVKMYVIPSGSISVSRDYSNNDTKLVTFSLVCVGDGISTSAGPPPKKSTKEEAFLKSVQDGINNMGTPFIGNGTDTPRLPNK